MRLENQRCCGLGASISLVFPLDSMSGFYIQHNQTKRLSEIICLIVFVFLIVSTRCFPLLGVSDGHSAPLQGEKSPFLGQFHSFDWAMFN